VPDGDGAPISITAGLDGDALVELWAGSGIHRDASAVRRLN